MPDKINPGVFYRSLQFDIRSLDEEKREATISFSSEEEIERWGIVEVLDHSAKAVDLRRLKTLGAHLFNHDPDRIIGPLLSAKLEEGRGVARVGYDDTDEGNLALARTKSGSLRGISVGYRVFKYLRLEEGQEYQLVTKKIKGRKDTPIYIATKWAPLEVSSTPVPADSTVGIGRDLSSFLDGIEIERMIKEDSQMTDEEIKKLLSDGIRAAIPEIGKVLLPTIVEQVRASQIEVAKPQIKMSTEEMIDLTNRAGAVSLECKSKVIDLIYTGKTAPEVQRFILDTYAGKPDAGNVGPPVPGDGSQRGGGIPEGQRDLKNIDDGVFFRSLSSPSEGPLS